jgi:hypothetical protein
MGRMQMTVGTLAALFILTVLLSLPRVSLQTEFAPSQANFKLYEPGTAQLEVAVTNKGGLLPGVDIITPDSCITAYVYGQFKCAHQLEGKNVSCTTPVCGLSRARELEPRDEMLFTFARPYPRNITFTIRVQSSFWSAPVASTTENYTCILNEDYVSYNC